MMQSCVGEIKSVSKKNLLFKFQLYVLRKGEGGGGFGEGV